MLKTNIPWIEKYRPKTFNEIIDQDEKIVVIENAIKNNELPHMIFYGPSGSGKTSLALAIVRKMFDNSNGNVLELNASDDRGIDIVRNKIKKFTEIASTYIRIIILDEADSMTSDAQSALSRIIEKRSINCRFILICNNINKILPNIQSRCAKMRFGYLMQNKIKTKIMDIVKLENISINDKAIDLIINLNKDFRQILNNLQCIHSMYSESGIKITSKHIYNFHGIPNKKEFKNILNILFNNPHIDAYNYMIDIYRSNTYDISKFINMLTIHILKTENNKDKLFFMINALSDIEDKLSRSNDVEVQLAYLVACCQKCL